MAEPRARVGSGASRLRGRPASDDPRADRDSNITTPLSRLRDRLTAAEYAVTGMLLDGLSLAQIAATRGTTYRTVASHIGSVFRKLRVSGRAELIARLTALDTITVASTEGTDDSLARQERDVEDALWSAAEDMWAATSEALVSAQLRASALLHTLEGS
jgi:DNA-binding CsgD family transcriptional regulator